jgi:hypothetical protein
VSCTGRHRLHPRTRPPPPPWPCRGRWHLCHWCQHPGRSPWGHPPGPAKRHHHSRHFHHPPLNHQHPSCDNGRRGSRPSQQKRATYSGVEPNGYPFVPFSVESSYMRWEMKRPALAGSCERPLLQAHCGRLANANLPQCACQSPAMCQRLCRCNFFMYHTCLGMFAKSSGTGFRAGRSVPTDEHGLL